MNRKFVVKRRKREILATRLSKLQKVVRAELGGKVFSEQEIAQIVKKSAERSS